MAHLSMSLTQCYITEASLLDQKICRAAVGVCDVPEGCSSSSLACPADGFVGAFTLWPTGIGAQGTPVLSAGRNGRAIERSV